MVTITSETLRRLWSNAEAPSAVYICDTNELIRNVENMDAAFRSRYGNFQIAYSFKTNYLGEIVKTARRMKLLAEVVSREECLYAIGNGYAKEDIVFNGVAPAPKTKYEIARNGIVNVDNYAEAADIAHVAEDRGTKVQLGVRMNFDIGNGVVSRFGVEPNSDEFKKIIGLFEDASELISFGGFHCHIGSARPVRYWKKRVEEMAELACKYEAKYIDIGGGMYGPMPEALSVQFDEYEGDFNEYARTVCSVMNRYFPDKECKLIVEPGTALVGDVMDMAAAVTSIKEIRGKTFVTVNCTSNHLGVISEIKDLPVEVLRNPHVPDGERTTVRNATVCGDTCLEFDYLKKGFDGIVGVGDRLLFRNVGAYSISSSRQFIVPRPAVVSADGRETFRQEETYCDMFNKYLFS